MDFQEIAQLVKKEVEKEIGKPIAIRKYRTSPWSGKAYLSSFEIIVPHPKSNISLSTYLHELGHLTNLARTQKKSCLREFYAERFCLDQLKRFSIKRNKRMIKHSNWYMAYSLAQAMNRKMKDIPEELKKYKKFLRAGHAFKIINGIPTKVKTGKYYAL